MSGRNARYRAAVLLLAASCSGAHPRVAPAPSPSPTASSTVANTSLSVDGRADAVETTGRAVLGTAALSFGGPFLLAATVRVSGGNRRLLVEGGEVTVRGPGLTLFSNATTLTATGWSAVGDPVPPKSAWDDAAQPNAFPRLSFGVGTAIEGTRVTLDGKGVPRVVADGAGSAVLYGTAQGSGMPAALQITQDDTGRSRRAATATPTFFSWRGTGTAAVGGKRYGGAHVTVIASALTIEVRRSGGELLVRGAGSATQVAVEGTPQLRARIAITGTPPKHLTRGSGEQMTWEESNVGPWEAIITSVRALNIPAGWVRYEVDDPPALVGPGGDTFAAHEPACAAPGAAFGEDHLCAQLAPGQVVDTPLIVNPPTLQASGVFTALFEVRGNFPTLIVRIPFTVVPRS